MDGSSIAELKDFIKLCKSDPTILNHPSLAFFRSYLHSLNAKIPSTAETPNTNEDVKQDEVDDDEIVESDIELDETDAVEPDNDPPQKMGAPSTEVSEENQDAAQMLKSKAMASLHEGCFEEAISELTEAILLNPHSAILYATRGGVFVKLKKPNAAIRDADAALEINPDSAKAYKVRGMARAMLGLWEGAANDLHVASKLDYDEEIDSVLGKVEANARKIEMHRRKYERLRKERELKKIEREKQRQSEAQAAHMKSSLKDGEVMVINSRKELETKLNAASKLNRLSVLYFTATWCGPCRQISPVYTGLAVKYPNVVFLKVDIDSVGDVASQWNISSVPCFFFIKNGKEMDKIIGADKSSLERKVAQYA